MVLDNNFQKSWFFCGNFISFWWQTITRFSFEQIFSYHCWSATSLDIFTTLSVCWTQFWKTFGLWEVLPWLILLSLFGLYLPCIYKTQQQYKMTFGLFSSTYGSMVKLCVWFLGLVLYHIDMFKKHLWKKFIDWSSITIALKNTSI